MKGVYCLSTAEGNHGSSVGIGSELVTAKKLASELSIQHHNHPYQGEAKAGKPISRHRYVGVSNCRLVRVVDRCHGWLPCPTKPWDRAGALAVCEHNDAAHWIADCSTAIDARLKGVCPEAP